METSDAFALHTLLSPAVPLDEGARGDSPVSIGRSLRCAEPYGRHAFLGSSDGRIYCFVQLDDDLGKIGNNELGKPANFGGQQKAGFMKHVGTRFISQKPIERILIMPALALAIVLSESTLTFHELPGFVLIPTQVLPHIKGVAAVALDEAQLTGTKSGTGLDAEGLANLCIIRRKAITLVKFSADTWRVTREIPLPGGATSARRFGKWLCISTTSEYNIVNLEEATLSSIGLPISQTSEAPSASSRPSIVAVPHLNKASTCDFLITSHSRDLTLGAFVSQEGEPTAKLLEWPSHPRALALDYPYLHALLRNDTIEIHNLESLKKEQTIQLPATIEPRILSTGICPLELSEDRGSAEFSKAQAYWKEDRISQLPDIKESSQNDIPKSPLVQSSVLLVGKNTVQYLRQRQKLSAAVTSLHLGDYYKAEEFTYLAQVQLQKEQQALQSSQLIYLNQMLGYHCLRMLRFEDAIQYLQQGQLHLYFFANFFPRLSKGLYNPNKYIDTFADVVSETKLLGDLESLPLSNLSLNYAPPLTLGSDPTLQKLQSSLVSRIQTFFKEMLAYYAQQSSVQEDPDFKRFLDTMYGRHLIEEKDRDRLSAFLLNPSCSCDASLVEKDLLDIGCYAALALHQERKGKYKEAMELQRSLLDGHLHDSEFKGTFESFAVLLDKCDDPEVTHQYGIWLSQRDISSGIRVLMKNKGDRPQSDYEVLRELERANPDTAFSFLEEMALNRKPQDAPSQKQLLESIWQRLVKALEMDQENDTMQTLAKEYVAGAYAESFVAHLALRAPQSHTIILRLKLMLLLQGSTVLDCQDVLFTIKHKTILTYEHAILLGKLQQDEEALDLLAIGLRDANSAETYCNQSRCPLSAVVIQSFDIPEIRTYAAFALRSLKRLASESKKVTRGTSKAPNNINLLKSLLKVYMKKDIDNEFQVATSHLLNTQAMHLSSEEVLEVVPSHWSVKTLETFLSRSLRREIHHSNEGHIQRALALSQNLEVAQDLWGKRRALGGVIEDGPDDGHDSDTDQGRILVEKAEAQEKGVPEATVEIIADKIPV